MKNNRSIWENNLINLYRETKKDYMRIQNGAYSYYTTDDKSGLILNAGSTSHYVSMEEVNNG